MSWNTDNIPALQGKTILVTGANSGLGFESSRALARRGAHVIMACRNTTKAESAVQAIRNELPQASLELLTLDLTSLRSVKEAAQRVRDTQTRLDVLLNNAGIMAMPYQQTADGFESQFGTNHLGHFALTAQLFPLLTSTPGARVINVSSLMHRVGRMRFDDLAWQKGYDKWQAYGMSKLSNLLFTYELARRCSERGLDITVACAHPGYSSTNLELRPSETQGNKLKRAVVAVYNPLFAQKAATGALPQLYASTAPEVRSGEYYGPQILEIWGEPKRVSSNARSHDRESMTRLWDVSQELTGVSFAALGSAPSAGAPAANAS